MKNFTYYIFFICFSAKVFAQPIVVNSTTNTVPQLVNNVLFGTGPGGQSACVGTISNITWQTGTTATNNGIGYFTNTNPSFPLTNGVILSTGSATSAAGPNGGTQSGGNWPGDTQLFDYITGLGIDPSLTDYNDATILEFDFVPQTTNMSFDFLFASEEYGTFQCSYADAFAFFLSDLTAGTPVTNLAVLPGTSTPISVLTIRNNVNNTSCPSVNPTFFGSYNTGNTAATNFNGVTNLITATSVVIPGHTYHIKLVIADRNDNAYDSAVFLGGGSFNVGQSDIVQGTGVYNFTPSFTIAAGTAICSQDSRVIRAGNSLIAGATYVWTKDGVVIPGASTNLYTVTQAGNYGVTVSKAGCTQSDTFLVESYPPFPTANPNDLISTTTFNLNSNLPIVLNGLSAVDYNVTFYNSLNDAKNFNNPIANLSTYPGVNGEIIFVSIEDINGGCVQYASFVLYTSTVIVAVASNSGPVCPSGVFDLFCTNAGPGYTYSWAGPNGFTSNLQNPTNVPAPTGTAPFVYIVTLTGATTYTSSTTVTLIAAANAGVDGNLPICDNNIAPIDLSTIITGEQTGGSWTRATGANGVFNDLTGIFTPAIGTTTSDFIYTVSGGTSGCAADTSIATVTINAAVNAGLDGTVTVCENSTTVINLNTLITGEQVGGTWTRVGTGGTFIAATGLFTPAIGATSSVFNYTLTGIAPCANDTSAVNVIISKTANAGTDANLTICDSNLSSINLNTLLTGQQSGGIWTRVAEPTLGTFTQSTGIFIPVDVVGTKIVTFKYEITGTLPCPNDDSLVTITINDQPKAGTDALINVCGNDTTPINLNTAITGEDAGGTWTRTGTGTGGTFVAATGIYTPAVGATESTFIYSLSANAPCVADESIVTVKFKPVPSATIVASTPAVCRGFASPTITFEGSNGTAPYKFTYKYNGILFTTAPSITNTIAVNVPTANAGAQTYELISVQDANCTNTFAPSTTVIVNVLTSPLFNVPTAYQVCDDNTVYDGVGSFNLHSKDLEITTNSSLQISYHSTEADAKFDLTEITANPYINKVPGTNTPVQTVWIRIFDPFAPACYSITQMDLIVNPRPLKNLLLTPFELCDVTVPFKDGKEPFNLHDKDADIINGQTGAITVNYYLTEAEAIANNTTPLANVYENTTINTQTIYYNASFNNTGCGTVGALELKVNPLPLATTPNYPSYVLCDATGSLGYEKFDLQSKISEILIAGQTTLDVSVKFYKDYASAIAGTVSSEITNLQYTNQIPYIQTIGIRLINNQTKCYILSSMDLIVSPLPAPNPLPLLRTTICDSDIDGYAPFDLNSYTADILQLVNPAEPITIEYYFTETDAINGVGVNLLPNPFTNSNAFTQTIYVRATNTVTKCFTVMPLTLTVKPSPVIPLLAPLGNLRLCDEDSNNQDGITKFNLTLQTPVLLTLQVVTNNYTITYYDNAAAANSTIAGLAIAYPTTFDGADNQEIWVRIEENISKCFITTSFRLVVNKPLALTTPAPLELCDNDYGIPVKLSFDLVKYANPEILKNVPLANRNDYTVAYYESQANANAGISPLNASGFENAANPQTIFVVVTTKIDANGNGGCRSFTTQTLNVKPLPQPKTDPPALDPKCDDVTPGDLKEIFDLTKYATYIKDGKNVTLRYFESAADATKEPPVKEIATPAAANVAGDVTIRVESNTSSNSFGEKCYVLVTQKLRVDPLPTVSTLDPAVHPGNLYQICQNFNPPVTNPVTPPVILKFDLNNLIPSLLLGNPTVIVPPATTVATYTTTFHTSALDAKNNTNPISQIDSKAYYPTTPIGTPQTIYVRVKNNITDCVNPYGTFQIVVNAKPTVTLPPALTLCDTDGKNDGKWLYPLGGAMDAVILNGQLPTDFTVTYYDSFNDAKSGGSAIANLGQYEAYTHSLWIRVENNTTKCYEIGESKQIVERIPEPTIKTINDVNTICVNYITKFVERNLLLQIDNPVPPQGPLTGIATPPIIPAVNLYQWYEKDVAGVYQAIPGATANTYLVNTAEATGKTRKFAVGVKSTSTPTPPLGCEVMSPDFDVIQSGPAVNETGTIGYYVTNAFASNQIVNVTVVGYGTYEYSLDDGPRQESPIFENVGLVPEFHKITVYDTKSGNNSCDEYVIEEVQTIDCPHFFTPNGDGFNDNWKIVGLKGQLDAKIYIFDRNGKLIKQLNPAGEGWDGTYNNNQMPSSDYWFTVDFSEQNIQKQFKSNFTLKR